MTGLWPIAIAFLVVFAGALIYGFWSFARGRNRTVKNEFGLAKNQVRDYYDRIDRMAS
jgi:hypothetical protein